MRRGTPSAALKHCVNLESLFLTQTDTSDVLGALPDSLVYFKVDDVFEVDKSNPRWAPTPAEWITRLGDEAWCPRLKFLRPWRRCKELDESRFEGLEMVRLCRKRGIRLI
jgi:hypothetical protein